jgi:hypothetical protein
VFASVAMMHSSQVIGACLLTRDTAAKVKHHYKEITMLEMKDVTAANEDYKK